MLGSAADAEDVVQETWLRWAGLAAVRGGELDTVAGLEIEGGRITRIYAVRNPQKLARLGEEVSLSRTG